MILIFICIFFYLIVGTVLLAIENHLKVPPEKDEAIMIVLLWPFVGVYSITKRTLEETEKRKEEK